MNTTEQIEAAIENNLTQMFGERVCRDKSVEVKYILRSNGQIVSYTGSGQDYRNYGEAGSSSTVDRFDLDAEIVSAFMSCLSDGTTLTPQRIVKRLTKRCILAMTWHLEKA